MADKFCPQCGNPRKPDSRFCGNCGLQFGSAVSPAIPAAPVPAQPQQGIQAWQTVVGNTLPAFAPVSASGVVETADEPNELRPSLRGTSWFILFTSANDLLCAYATQDPGAISSAKLRAGITAATWLFGMIAGSSRGFFAKLMAFSSLILAFVQGASLYQIIRSVLRDPRIVGPIISQVAALFSGSSFDSLMSSIASNPNLLGGNWMNILTQSISMIAAFNAFRLSRK